MRNEFGFSPSINSVVVFSFWVLSLFLFLFALLGSFVVLYFV